MNLCASPELGRISGHILDPHNAPLVGAHLKLVNAAGALVSEAKSDEQGNFVLGGIRLAGKKFRAFVHAPEQMAAALESSGMVRDTQGNTLLWMLDLYHRGSTKS